MSVSECMSEGEGVSEGRDREEREKRRKCMTDRDRRGERKSE